MADFVQWAEDYPVGAAVTFAGWAIVAYVAYAKAADVFWTTLPVAEDSPKQGSAAEQLKVFSPGGEHVGVAASASPFCTKIELFCRMAGIPYVRFRPDMLNAPKGKMPYIEHGSNRFGDSTFILKYLEATFFAEDGSRVGAQVRGAGARMTKGAGGAAAGDAAGGVVEWSAPGSASKYAAGAGDEALPALVRTADLSPADAGVATGLKAILESSLYQLVTADRWLTDTNWPQTYTAFLGGIPAVIRPCLAASLRAGVRKDMWARGHVRHSPGDRAALAGDDLDALEAALAGGKARWAAAPAGSKHGRAWFVFGAAPAAIDAALFACLDNMANDTFTTPWKGMLKTRPLCLEYTANMRAVYFGLDA